MKRRASSLTGAPVQADINDPYIQEIANAALAEVDGRSNALYRQKVVRIVEAKKQVCIFFFSQLYHAFLILSNPFTYQTNAELDCSKRMLKFTLIFKLKVLLHVLV